MLALKTFKLIVIGSLAALALYSGVTWYKGKIEDAKNSVVQQYTESYVKDIEEKLKASQRLSNTQQEVIKQHENTVRDITDKLDTALDSLSKRPYRTKTVVVSDNSGASCSIDNTGSGLSREDAEFLTREAALAATIQSERDELLQLYNAVREEINKHNGQN